MKILFLCLLLLVSWSAKCQKLVSKEVPENIHEAFTTLYPHVGRTSWVRVKRDVFSAEFSKDDINYKVAFDSTGIVLEKDTEINFDTLLPAQIQDSLKNNAAKYSFVRAIKVEKPDRCPRYLVDVARERSIITKVYSVGCKP